MSGGNQYQVRALQRALRILNSFSLATPELSLTDIAARVDVPKSTAFRLLSVLEEHGYVYRASDSESYRVGVRLFELGSVYIQSTTLEAEAQSYLRELAFKCHQTANLGVLQQGDVVHIAVVPPDRPIRYFSNVGDREKAYCTGLGKVLISEFSRTELEEMAGLSPLEKHTDHTITDLDELDSHLQQVRQQGYAFDNEERFLGLRCIAAPIRDDRQRIVAAISVSGHAPEFTNDKLPFLIKEVRESADAVSRRLGGSVVGGTEELVEG